MLGIFISTGHAGSHPGFRRRYNYERRTPRRTFIQSRTSLSRRPIRTCHFRSPGTGDCSLEPGHQHLLDGWEFEPDQLQVRFITGDDGREKIQMRIDLGVIQMEIDGRPDGERPEGFESLLDAMRRKPRKPLEAGTPFLARTRRLLAAHA